MMAEKKGFLLRVSPETLVELERWAQAEFRSVNGQIEYVLAEALRKRKKTAQKKSKDAEKDDLAGQQPV